MNTIQIVQELQYFRSNSYRSFTSHRAKRSSPQAMERGPELASRTIQ